MLVRVKFKNQTDIIIEESEISQWFSEDDDIEILPLEGQTMTASEIKRHNAKFESLVGAIDSKFAHSYTEPEECPELSDDMREYLDEIVRLTGKDTV